MQAVIVYFYSFMRKRTGGGFFFALFLFRLSHFSRLLAKERYSFPNVMSVPTAVPHNSVPEVGTGYCF